MQLLGLKRSDWDFVIKPRQAASIQRAYGADVAEAWKVYCNTHNRLCLNKELMDKDEDWLMTAIQQDAIVSSQSSAVLRWQVVWYDYLGCLHPEAMVGLRERVAQQAAEARKYAEVPASMRYQGQNKQSGLDIYTVEAEDSVAVEEVVSDSLEQPVG